MDKIKQIAGRYKKQLILLLVALAGLYGALHVFSATNSTYTHSSGVGYGESMEMVAPQMARGMEIDADYAVADSVYYQEPQALYEPAVDRQLVRRGSISMSVKDIEQTRISIEALVAESQGFVSSQNFNDSTHYNQYGEQYTAGRSGNMTAKIPGDKYGQVFAAIRDLGLVVSNESSNTQDVTEQYSDLQTRLENKKREEDQYRTILTQAKKVSDILEVTRYIEQARGEVERLQGQINVLSNQISLATISVYIESERSVAIGGVSWDPGAELAQAWNSLVSGLVGLINNIIGWLVLLPLLALYVAIYGGLAYATYRLGRILYIKIK